MFRLFNKSALDLEEKDLDLLIHNSEEIARVAQSLVKEITLFKRKPGLAEGFPLDIHLRNKLREILTLLHSEDAEAKDAIRQELKREKGKR